MGRNRDKHADEVARLLRQVLRVRGIPLLAAGRLYLLTQPLPVSPDPRGLAGALLADGLPDSRSLARLCGAREVLEIDGSRLSVWARAVSDLGARRDVDRLRAAGHPQLRKYREIDEECLIAEATADLARVGRLHGATSVLPPCHEAWRDIDTGDLLRLLDLRCGALADWAIDPVDSLLTPECHCDGLLIDGAETGEGIVSTLCALLLGIRNRDLLVEEQSALLRRLPSRCEEAFRAGVDHLGLPPIPAACWISGLGAPPPDLRETPASSIPEQIWRVCERVLPLLGPVTAGSTLEALLIPRIYRPTDGEWSAGDSERLTLVLASAGLRVRIPSSFGFEELRPLVDVAVGMGFGRCRPLWSSLLTSASRGTLASVRRLLRRELPDALVARAVDLRVERGVTRFGRSTTHIDHYLACIEALRGSSAPMTFDPEAEWFIGMFRAAGSWVSALILAHLHGPETPRRHEPEKLHALAHAIQGADPTPACMLERWATPKLLEPPPECESVAKTLDLPEEVTLAYLHHRRLTGHGESFSKAILEALAHDTLEQREVEGLERLLTTESLPTAERQRLEKRLATLRDPAARAGRRRAASRRARRRLERDLIRLRSESLERTLSEITRAALEGFLGRSLPNVELPPGFEHALHLCGADHMNHRLLTSYAEDVLRGRPLEDRDENRRWLEAAAASGTDVDTWLEGVSAVVEVDGEVIEFSTEKDPLQVLRMGSYFDTCLSLDGGCNAASTLVNALDVNKQVIYGRRRDGSVVARKLIGATIDGRMVGYRAYATGSSSAVRDALAPALAQFADRCRLRLDDRGTPEVLSDGFWYDDGNESWPRPCGANPDPRDRAIEDERDFVRATLDGDPQTLVELARHGDEPWRHAAVLRLLLSTCSDRLQQGCELIRNPVADVSSIFDNELAIAVARGRLHESTGLSRIVSDEGCYALQWLLAAQARVPELADRLLELARHATHGTGPADWLPHPNIHLATMHSTPLLELLSGFASLPTDEYCLQPWWTVASELLHLAYLRDRQPAPLARAFARGPEPIRRALLKVAAEEVIPGIAPHLRQALREKPDDHLVALALGRQGEPADAPRLLDLLRRTPSSLALAAAVCRCGYPEAAEETRSLWTPPGTPDRLLRNPRLLRLAREVGSTRLARRVTRQLRRLAASRDEPTLNLTVRLKQIALLAAPAPEGDPTACLESLRRVDAPRSHRVSANELHDLWSAARAVTTTATQLRSGDAAVLPALLSLDPELWPDLEWPLLDAIVHGDRQLQSACVDTCRRIASKPLPSTLAQRLLPLLGRRRFDLPESARLWLAEQTTVLDQMVPWLENCSDARRIDRLAHCLLQRKHDWDGELGVDVVYLNDSDPLAHPLGRDLCAALAQLPVAAAAKLLDDAYKKLHPRGAESFATEVFTRSSNPPTTADEIIDLLSSDDIWRSSVRLQRTLLAVLGSRLSPPERTRLEALLAEPDRPERLRRLAQSRTQAEAPCDL